MTRMLTVNLLPSCCDINYRLIKTAAALFKSFPARDCFSKLWYLPLAHHFNIATSLFNVWHLKVLYIHFVDGETPYITFGLTHPNTFLFDLTFYFSCWSFHFFSVFCLLVCFLLIMEWCVDLLVISNPKHIVRVLNVVSKSSHLQFLLFIQFIWFSIGSAWQRFIFDAALLFSFYLWSLSFHLRLLRRFSLLFFLLFFFVCAHTHFFFICLSIV